MIKQDSANTLPAASPPDNIMKRYWEIDTIRGLAVFAMLSFHSVYILANNSLLNLNVYTGFWWIFPRLIAAVFLLLVGVCLSLSYRRTAIRANESTQKTPGFPVKFLIRSSVLLGIGLIISLISWLIMGERMVFFGILHLIGCAILLAYPLVKYKWINLVTGIGILAAGLWLGRLKFGFYWLLWLGFRPADYYPVDYLPLLPWFSFVLLGVFLGNLLYSGGKRRFRIPEWDDHLPIRGFSWLGRHSLVIYLVHLPLLYGIAWLWQAAG